MRKVSKKRSTSTKVKTNKRGKESGIQEDVTIHLVVTRKSGDTERYLLGRVPDLRYAIDFRHKLAKVRMPKHLAPFWMMPKPSSLEKKSKKVA